MFDKLAAKYGNKPTRECNTPFAKTCRRSWIIQQIRHFHLVKVDMLIANRGRDSNNQTLDVVDEFVKNCRVPAGISTVQWRKILDPIDVSREVGRRCHDSRRISRNRLT